LWIALQEVFLERSTNARQTFTHRSHNVHMRRRDLVVRTAWEVAQQA
jgi:hypothetical protein